MPDSKQPSHKLQGGSGRRGGGRQGRHAGPRGGAPGWSAGRGREEGSYSRGLSWGFWKAGRETVEGWPAWIIWGLWATGMVPGCRAPGQDDAGRGRLSPYPQVHGQGEEVWVPHRYFRLLPLGPGHLWELSHPRRAVSQPGSFYRISKIPEHRKWKIQSIHPLLEIRMPLPQTAEVRAGQKFVEMPSSKEDLRGSNAVTIRLQVEKGPSYFLGPEWGAASPSLGKPQGLCVHLGTAEFQEESAKQTHVSTSLAGRWGSLCELHLLPITVLGLGVVLLLAIAAWRQWRQNKIWRKGALRASGHRCCWRAASLVHRGGSHDQGIHSTHSRGGLAVGRFTSPQCAGDMQAGCSALSIGQVPCGRLVISSLRAPWGQHHHILTSQRRGLGQGSRPAPGCGRCGGPSCAASTAQADLSRTLSWPSGVWVPPAHSPLSLRASSLAISMTSCPWKFGNSKAGLPGPRSRAQVIL